MNNLFELYALGMSMKLPRAQPKIMGVPVSIETAKSLSRAGRDMMMRRYVPQAIQEERLAICQACPSWKDYRCTECGCQLRVKTSLTSSECPLKKWGRVLNLGDAGINATEHKESTK
jgi:hypothetical protein